MKNKLDKIAKDTNIYLRKFNKSFRSISEETNKKVKEIIKKK